MVTQKDTLLKLKNMICSSSFAELEVFWGDLPLRDRKELLTEYPEQIETLLSFLKKDDLIGCVDFFCRDFFSCLPRGGVLERMSAEHFIVQGCLQPDGALIKKTLEVLQEVPATPMFRLLMTGNKEALKYLFSSRHAKSENFLNALQFATQSTPPIKNGIASAFLDQDPARQKTLIAAWQKEQAGRKAINGFFEFKSLADKMALLNQVGPSDHPQKPKSKI